MLRRSADARTLVTVAIALCACILSGCRRHYGGEAAHLTGGDPRRGVQAIGRYGCGSCHDIPGVRNARGTVGPPLARIAVRTYLAGRVMNTPAGMIRWIQHPQQIEQGTAMPDMGVTETDARDIAAYLYTLR